MPPLITFLKNTQIPIMEVGNITKVATLKSFLHLSYKTHIDTFFVAVLFNIFKRQT